MLRRLALIATACMLCACESPDQKANTLFVEAAQALTSAQGTTDITKQHAELTAAKKTLSTIVTDYPGSSAAVRIAANEKIGPYSMAELTAAIATLAQNPAICFNAFTRQCYTDLVFGSLERYSKLEANQTLSESDETLSNSGWSFATITAPEKVKALLQPDGYQVAGAFIMEHSFKETLTLLITIGKTQGQAALVKAITTLNATPGFKANAEANIETIFDEFLKHANPHSQRQANSATLLRAAVGAIMNPLPEKIATALNQKICSFNTETSVKPFATADCTPAQIAAAFRKDQHLPPVLQEEIYAVAPDEKKAAIAMAISLSPDLPPDQKYKWLQRTEEADNFYTLSHLYFEAVSQNPALASALAQKLKTATGEKRDNKALTDAGITQLALILHHAGGTLAAQLPALLQNIDAQPDYSRQLSDVIKTLISLQPATPGTDQLTLFRHVGKAMSKWTIKEGLASRTWTIRDALNSYPKDADPRPAFDALHAGAPYAETIEAEEAMRFRTHGHTDIVETAMAATDKDSFRNGIREQLARMDVLNAITSKDFTKAIAMLEAMERGPRLRAIFYSLHRDSGLPAATRDAFLPLVLDKYAVSLAAHEVARNAGFGIPLPQLIETVIANYAQVEDLIERKPDLWLLKNFDATTPEQRLRALKAMYQTGNQWPVYASAVALVDGG